MKRAILLAIVAALAFGVVAPAASAQPSVFRAVLSGGGEVPPTDSRARGVATFMVNADETELTYRLVLANIQDVVQAHIHVGASDVNGPVVVFLLHPVDAPLGRFSGVVAQGTVTASDLVGPLAGHPLSDLVAEMEAGNTYTNAHTVVHPGGEIRGQIF